MSLSKYRASWLDVQLKNCLFELVTKVDKKVLQQVLHWGTPRRRLHQCFYDYLVQEKKVPLEVLCKIFNDIQRRKLEKSGDRFDITLLFTCVQYGCDGLAPPKDSRWRSGSQDCVESLVSCLKDYRNSFFHEEYEIDIPTFLDKVEELSRLANNAVTKAAELYNIDELLVIKKLKEINAEITCIRDKALNNLPRNKSWWDKICHKVKYQTIVELRKKYRSLSNIDILSHLTEKKLSIRVNKIFTQLSIKRHQAHVYGGTEHLAFEDLLQYVEEARTVSGKGSTMLLLEGPAGAGKTTFIRKVVSDWASGFSTMKNLTNYEIVILSECKDGGTRSLTQLLQFLVPDTSRNCQNEHFMLRAMQRSKLLFIVDGLDELNSSSEQVLRDILMLGDSADITILCTTRPNKVMDFEKYIPHNFNVLYAKILGISEGKREEFVITYSYALQNEGEDKDVSGLLQYLKRKDRRLQEHWKLPFNLVLVTILWSQDTESVTNMTSATDIYMKTTELCKKRLEQRLHGQELTRTLNSDEINEKVTKFMKMLYSEAFINHYSDNTVMSESSVQRLRDVCGYLRLPAAEVLGSFLMHTVSLTGGTKRKYSFPHKGIQDLFSALHVRESLMADEMVLDIPRVLSAFKTILGEYNVTKINCHSLLEMNKVKLMELQKDAINKQRRIHDALTDALKEAATLTVSQEQVVQLHMRKWQSIIVHLTGLLYRNCKTVSEHRAKELVELLRESGISGDQWLDLLPEVKCNASFVKHIELHGQIRVTDGRVEAFMKVLDHLEPSSVAMSFSSNSKDIPRLEELIEALREKTWKMELVFTHDFRCPKQGGSALDCQLQKFFLRSQVTKYKGQLSARAMAALPPCMECLHLSIKDSDHYMALLPILSSLKNRLPRLRVLGLHLTTEVKEFLLRPLPDVNYLVLTIANVREETVGWACRVARALQPSNGNGFYALLFPHVLRNKATYLHLLESLALAGVPVRSEVYASPTVDAREWDRLSNLTERILNCKFIMCSEDFFW